MRWNGVIQNQKNTVKNIICAEKFNNSCSQASLNYNNSELKLKSIEKVKQELPALFTKEMISTASHNSSKNNSKSQVNKKISKGT